MPKLRLTLAFALLAYSLTACTGTRRSRYLLTDATPATADETTLLIVADHHQHPMLGQPHVLTPSSAWLGPAPTIRSPLVDIGSDPLLREAVRFGRAQGAQLVLHLGDASNVSCFREAYAAYSALEEEAPHAWYFTPGGHDGLFAGGIRRLTRSMWGDTSSAGVYRRPPSAGFEPGSYSWEAACRSPLDDIAYGEIYTKDEIEGWYMGPVKGRPGATSWLGDSVMLNIGDEYFKCKVENVLNPRARYAAVSRRCPRQYNSSASLPWSVGPYESFLVQRIRIGATHILLLDTSHFLEPHETRLGLRGSLGEDQKKAADELLVGTRRDQVIVLAHHPFVQLSDADQRWIAERGNRYISAHLHESATLRMHHGRQDVLELNVGSLADAPQQAVVMVLGPGSARFRVAGADVEHTGWPGFVAPCEERREEWALEPDVYRRYRRDSYVPDLIEAATLANSRSAAAGNLDIPAGTDTADWVPLAMTLNEIRRSTGEMRTFWACQAYYAAEATRRRGLFGWLGRRPNGMSVTGEWYRFEVPSGR